MKSRKRLALLHSDGSITVYSPNIGIEQARNEAVDFDENQDDPVAFTRVVSLRVEDIDVLEVPSLSRDQTCKPFWKIVRSVAGLAPIGLTLELSIVVLARVASISP